jgi:glycerol-3-phosphate acyltransferase PlsX
MRLGIDIMGGDYAPQSPLEGVKIALPGLPPDVKLVLYGNEEVIRQYIQSENLPQDRLEVVNAPQVIEMGESPTKAMATKPESSIMLGLRALKTGDIDLYMSAGSTGAMYVGALYTVKAIEGIMRPAIASILPKENGSVGLILDVGANADCKPEVLVQFAILGSIYAKNIYNISNPKVGLLNIGSEPEKGNLVTQAAYPLLENNEKIDFAGNIEGYDLFSDKADVIVCDGFTGNVVLKTGEGIYHIMKQRGIKDEYFDRYDYENYGGTPILGINKPVIIAHGVSSPEAFRNMIHTAIQVVNSGVTDKLKQAFQLQDA